MKFAIIIRKSVENGKLVAYVVDDFYHGNVDRYRNMYHTDLYDVVCINIVERMDISLN